MYEFPFFPSKYMPVCLILFLLLLIAIVTEVMACPYSFQLCFPDDKGWTKALGICIDLRNAQTVLPGFSWATKPNHLNI